MKRIIFLFLYLAVLLTLSLTGCNETAGQKVQAKSKKPVDDRLHVVSIAQQTKKLAILEELKVADVSRGYQVWTARLGENGYHVLVRSAVIGLAPGDEVFLVPAEDGGFYFHDLWRKKALNVNEEE